jgi:hypothetical protein
MLGIIGIVTMVPFPVLLPLAIHLAHVLADWRRTLRRSRWLRAGSV